MYSENIIFMFYSKSSDLPYPGCGSGEKISEECKNSYLELSKIPQWRKKLSNFWLINFELDGHTWASVEHYYQGSKFKKENPEFYIQFSLDSGSQLSKNTSMAKSAGGKTGKVKGKQFRNKTITADNDFFNTERVNKEMFDAQYAKFTQNENMKKILIETKQAKLIHHVRGGQPIFFENLINIRNLIKNL
jgi:predicted NAD-dependent protein-ADP-ribosyltransferase YbiA (DUF1768 family)